MRRSAVRFRDSLSVESGVAVVQAGTLGSGYTLDLSLYAHSAEVLVVGTLNANLTIAVSNLYIGASFAFELHQDGTGGRTVTFPAATLPAGSLAVDAAAAATTVVSFYSPDGATLVGYSSALGTLDTLTAKRLIGGGLQPFTTIQQTGSGAAVVTTVGQPQNTDIAGSFDLTMRSTPAPTAGNLLIVGFGGGTFTRGRPTVILQPLNAAAFDAQLYPLLFGNAFHVYARNAPVASATLSFSYHVVG